MSRFLIAALLALAPSLGNAAEAPEPPLEVLKRSYPSLYRLYMGNQTYWAGFGDYAKMQGFRKPFEHLAVVVHEMIHIDSAVHAGYFIDGIYYEPYLKREAWPPIANKDVRPYMIDAEKGIIYSLYVLNTPSNHLGNVIDEINAHSHVLAFICTNEPEAKEKHLRNLVGHLHLQEAYLRVTRMGIPGEYQKMLANPESRGALITITERAWLALRTCGVPDQAIPAQEAAYFAALVRQLK